MRTNVKRLNEAAYIPSLESPATASIPFINLFALMASSVENNGLAEPIYKRL